MRRYKNIDIMRSLAIIIIIVYHCYAIAGQTLTHFLYIDKLIGYGGEIGVTLFFILSGFGISCSILNAENQNHPYTWKLFMKKRLKRIVPQYYVCLCVMLLLTDASVFIGTKEGLFHIFSHFCFIHNFTVETHGSINGAMWALAAIIQFYLIALFLQKLMKQHKWIILVASIVITVILKMLVFGFIAGNADGNGTYYFVYGRQLFTALDNFVVGMFLANIFMSDKKYPEKGYNWIGVIFLFLIMVGLVLTVDKIGLYTNTLYGWCWHSLLALVLGGILFFFVQCPMPFQYLEKGLLWISKYEYGIYIWHIVLIYNLLGKSAFFQLLANKSYILFTTSILIISVITGYFSTRFIDKE